MAEPGKVAKTVVDTGPDDDAAVADVYGLSSLTTADSLSAIKNIVTALSGNDTSSAGQLKGEIADGLINAKRKTEEQDKKAKDAAATAEAKERLKTGGTNTNQLEKIDPTMLDSIAKNIELAKKKNKRNYFYDENGNKITVQDPTKLNSASKLFKFAGDVMDDPEVQAQMDAQPQLAMFDEILKQSMALGVPDLIDKGYQLYKDQQEAKQALIDGLESTVKRGDLDTTIKIFGYIGGPAVMAKMPSFHQQMLKYYKIPKNTPKSSYPGLGTKLVGLLDDVLAGWDKGMRGGVVTDELTPFIGIGSDATSVLCYMDRFQARVIMAPSYVRTDGVAYLKDLYPALKVLLGD